MLAREGRGMTKRRGRSRVGTKVALRNLSDREREEIETYLRHIQEYEIHVGATSHVELYFTYVHDFSEYHPELYTEMGPRTFSLRLRHVLGLKPFKKKTRVARRSVAGKLIKPDRIAHYSIPKLAREKIQHLDAARIAA
jgi:hypothetical protein